MGGSKSVKHLDSKNYLVNKVVKSPLKKNINKRQESVESIDEDKYSNFKNDTLRSYNKNFVIVDHNKDFINSNSLYVALHADRYNKVEDNSENNEPEKLEILKKLIINPHYQPTKTEVKEKKDRLKVEVTQMKELKNPSDNTELQNKNASKLKETTEYIDSQENDKKVLSRNKSGISIITLNCLLNL